MILHCYKLIMHTYLQDKNIISLVYNDQPPATEHQPDILQSVAEMYSKSKRGITLLQYCRLCNPISIIYYFLTLHCFKWTQMYLMHHPSSFILKSNNQRLPGRITLSNKAAFLFLFSLYIICVIKYIELYTYAREICKLVLRYSVRYFLNS